MPTSRHRTCHRRLGSMSGLQSVFRTMRKPLDAADHRPDTSGHRTIARLRKSMPAMGKIDLLARRPATALVCQSGGVEHHWQSAPSQHMPIHRMVRSGSDKEIEQPNRRSAHAANRDVRAWPQLNFNRADPPCPRRHPSKLSLPGERAQFDLLLRSSAGRVQRSSSRHPPERT